MTYTPANNVFILGAGASVHARVPVMRNFIRAAEDVMAYNGEKEEFADDFRNVFEAISLLRPSYATSKMDLNNIEDLFGVMEMGVIVSRLGTQTDKAKIIGYRDSLRRVIVRTIEHTMRFQGTPKVRLRSSEQYALLADTIINHAQSNHPYKTSSVITFNYDCGMDIAFEYRSDGTSEDIDYGLDDNRSGYRLLKLHGSINWATEFGADKSGPIHVLPIAAQGSQRALITYQVPDRVGLSYLHGLRRGRYHAYTGEMKQLDLDPVIVPPTWSKGEHQSRISKVWELAAKDLAGAQNIFIIGYSLPETDSFFRHLMSLGTSTDVSRRRFWVFDPDKSGSVKGRYKRIIGDGVSDARYFPMKFDNAAISLIQAALKNEPGDPKGEFEWFL
jgi:hypothetical protein